MHLLLRFFALNCFSPHPPFVPFPRNSRTRDRDEKLQVCSPTAFTGLSCSPLNEVEVTSSTMDQTHFTIFQTCPLSCRREISARRRFLRGDSRRGCGWIGNFLPDRIVKRLRRRCIFLTGIYSSKRPRGRIVSIRTIESR